MRFNVFVVCLLAMVVTGCDPVQEVRKMREKASQRRKENNERQVEKAMENFNIKREGLDKAEAPNGESSRP